MLPIWRISRRDAANRADEYIARCTPRNDRGGWLYGGYGCTREAHQSRVHYPLVGAAPGPFYKASRRRDDDFTPVLPILPPSTRRPAQWDKVTKEKRVNNPAKSEHELVAARS